MISTPITKRMLTCSASLFSVQTMNEDREIVWNGEIQLNNIWFTVANAQSNGAQGSQSSDTMTLYFDVTNSKAFSNGLEVTPHFEKGQRVTIDGVNYTINSITPCYAFNGVHHYELGLN